MKTKLINFSFIINVLLSFTAFSQNTTIDSLKNEILNTLNNNNLEYVTSNVNDNHKHHLKQVDTVFFVNSQLVVKALNETKSVDLIDLQNVIYTSHNRHISIINTMSDPKDFKSEIEIWYPYFEGSSSKKQKLDDEKRELVITKLYRDFENLQILLRNEYYSNEVLSFQVTVTEYNSLAKKPSLSEEQRKLIVQANSIQEKKEYLKALIYYEKAMKLNPISRPDGYFNMGLLASEIIRYDYAIMCMKKYIMLMPNSEDARKAQDKIYEWELNLK